MSLSTKALAVAHRALIRLSGGRAGWELDGMPVASLTTTGRRTGKPRTVLVLSPVRIYGEPVVIAALSPDRTPPTWFLNLSANPEVSVSVQGEPEERRRARIVGDEEAILIRDRIEQRYPKYAEKRNDRDPVVVLESI